MARVINIDTKNRTIRIENAADGDIKTWRTTESGAHFPIKKGESTKEALDKFVEKKRPEAKKEDNYDLKFAGDIKKGDIVSAGGKDYKIIQADRNWVIGLDGKGSTLKIRPEISYDIFKVKKQPAKPSKKGFKGDDVSYEQWTKRYDITPEQRMDEAFAVDDLEEEWGKAKKNLSYHGLSASTVEDIYDYALNTKKYNADDIIEALQSSSHDKIDQLRVEAKKYQEKAAKQQPAKPSKKADVSDIIKSYKEKMAALGPKASIKKTDRVEADAIKEFMTRKLGANRPYEDYYQYWLNGMDKKTREEFEEIYNESEAREMAFSELASDVDHSGLARGEPTYDELMQWAEKQKAKKAESDRLAKEADEFEKTTKRDRERQQRKEHTEWTRNTLTDDEAEAIDIIRKWKRGEIGDDEFMNIGKRLKESAIKTIKK